MPICIRNLKAFKRGCPGSNECPCWKELQVRDENNPVKIKTKSQCIDLWNFDLQYDMLRLLEGNQEAIERFRNAVAQPDPNDPLNDNKASPKPDPAILKLVELLNEEKANRKAIVEYQVKKLLEHKK